MHRGPRYPPFSTGKNPARFGELQKRNAGINWYYAKNSYYFFFNPVSAFGKPGGEASLYVVSEGFRLLRQEIRHLEYWKVKYDMEAEERIAQARERTFRVASAALWDNPASER